MYVRSPYSLLSPAWNSSVRSADGMNVYSLEYTPVLLLSDKGKMVRAYLSGEEQANGQ
jgi:intracellular multiplication protein IcmK